MNRAERRKMERRMKAYNAHMEKQVGDKRPRELTKEERKEATEALYEIEIHMIEKLIACSCEEVSNAVIANLNMNLADMGEYALICSSNDKWSDFMTNLEQNMVRLRWRLNDHNGDVNKMV